MQATPEAPVDPFRAPLAQLGDTETEVDTGGLTPSSSRWALALAGTLGLAGVYVGIAATGFTAVMYVDTVGTPFHDTLFVSMVAGPGYLIAALCGVGAREALATSRALAAHAARATEDSGDVVYRSLGRAVRRPVVATAIGLAVWLTTCLVVMAYFAYTVISTALQA